MKTITAIQLWNNLCTTEVGSAEGEEVSQTTKFGIFALTQDCPLFLKHSIYLQKEIEVGARYPVQDKVDVRNKEIRKRNMREVSQFVTVANTLRAWADAIEVITEKEAV